MVTSFGKILLLLLGQPVCKIRQKIGQTKGSKLSSGFYHTIDKADYFLQRSIYNVNYVNGLLLTY